MAIKLVQPGGISHPSSSFIHPGFVAAPGPTGITDWPLAGFIRFTPHALPGALGSRLISFTSMPPGFGGYDHFSVGCNANPDLRVFAGARDGVLGGVGSSYGPQITLNEWQSCGFNFTSDTSRKVYRSGVPGTEDTTFIDFPNGTEDILVGAGATVTVDTYNKGFAGCIQDLTIWKGISLTDGEHLALHGMANPWQLQDRQEAVWRYLKFNDIGTAVKAYTVSAGALVPAADWLINVHEEDGGSVTTCEDSFSVPEPPGPPAEGCDTEDEADASAPADVTWPECDLVPNEISLDIVSPTVSPGRSLAGREQIVHADAGCWRITLSGIKLWTKAQVLLWRQIESKLNGRNGTVLVPAYEAKLSGTPITATAAEAYPIGAVRLKIDQMAGTDICAGMHFSAGEWMYRLKRVFGDDGDGFTSVLIWPPLREAIAAVVSLNFNTPRCRCRLERDDGMNAMLEHLKFGMQSVVFLEDV